MQTDFKLEEALCSDDRSRSLVMKTRSDLRRLMKDARNDALGFQVVCRTANFRWVFLVAREGVRELEFQVDFD